MTNVGQFCINVADLERSVTFYSERVDFAEHVQEVGADLDILLRDGRAHVGLDEDRPVIVELLP